MNDVEVGGSNVAVGWSVADGRYVAVGGNDVEVGWSNGAVCGSRWELCCSRWDCFRWEICMLQYS